MRRNFKIASPETVGFCVLGAAAGAVLAGGDAAAFPLASLAALAGAFTVMATLMVPWAKLFRPRATVMDQPAPS